MQPKRLSVLGIGLLGGSLGLAVKRAATSCFVAGYARNPETLRTALDRGAIDQGYGDPVAAVRGADLVVLCTPVGVLCNLLDEIAPALERTAIVTDVGSTKRSIVSHARRGGYRFVGSHPMAGSEKQGVQWARADLYEGALCITTPDEGTEPEALEAVESFWRLLQMRTRRLTPEDHDRLIGDVSHLPHALAAALVHAQESDALTLAGKGFLDATRIAGGDAGLWRDILMDNRDHLLDSMRKVRGEMDRLASLLERSDADGLRAWLDEAAKRRTAAGSGKTRMEDGG
jgi:prephenate dehydrogenase